MINRRTICFNFNTIKKGDNLESLTKLFNKNKLILGNEINYLKL